MDGGSKERERIGYDSVPWQSGSSARVFYCVFTTEKRLGELLGITKKMKLIALAAIRS